MQNLDIENKKSQQILQHEKNLKKCKKYNQKQKQAEIYKSPQVKERTQRRKETNSTSKYKPLNPSSDSVLMFSKESKREREKRITKVHWLLVTFEIPLLVHVNILLTVSVLFTFSWCPKQNKKSNLQNLRSLALQLGPNSK